MTPEAHHRIADEFARAGQFGEAEKHLLAAIQAQPNFGAAHYLLSTIRNYTPDDEHIAALRAQLAQPEPDARNKSRICFALAKALDQLGEYEEAFQLFTSANELRGEEGSFDIDSEWNRVQRRIAMFDSDLFSRLSGCGFECEQSVFVVSMPRSGSTLIEQILDCHPMAHGIGESKLIPKLLGQSLGGFVAGGDDMPDIERVPTDTWGNLGRSYVEQTKSATSNASRTIDKQPFNYRLLGEIHLMLPRARFIWCKRDPLDTCVSCFTNAFRNAPVFCNGLEELGAAYRMHDALMHHWKAAMPEAIYTVSYEDMVDDAEAAVRATLDLIGLDWDPACMEFDRSQKQVSTASQVQIRQPLYRHSVGRWKHYAPWLQPLQAALDKY